MTLPNKTVTDSLKNTVYICIVKFTEACIL
uniref:Uncharacterized protein n=1 Tax=Anguilla anguilla TaxID=7936 RepID=A0A0E9WF04_ANGAN